jgi:hypothetical protein
MTPLKNNGLIDYNKYSRQKRYTRQGKPRGNRGDGSDGLFLLKPWGRFS